MVWKQTAAVGERKVAARGRSRQEGEVAAFPSFEPQWPERLLWGAKGAVVTPPDATLRPSMPAGEQAGLWVTWNLFFFAGYSSLASGVGFPSPGCASAPVWATAASSAGLRFRLRQLLKLNFSRRGRKLAKFRRQYSQR